MHDHLDAARLVVSCPACIATVRAMEEAARWATAPVREVTWKCSYRALREDWLVSFACEVGVPDDLSDVWELDEQYADVVGEAFVMALPDSIPMDETEHAMVTMEVESITVGRVVSSDAMMPDDQPSLFET